MIITYEYKGLVSEIEFDATITAAHQSSSTVTEHAVEKGSPISDHVRQLADRLSVEAMVSNTPIKVPTTQMRGVSGSVQSTSLKYEEITRGPLGFSTPTPKSASVEVLRFDGAFDRVRDVYAELKIIEVNGLAVGVRTVYRGGLVDYTDMALTSLTIPIDVNSGSAKLFQFELVKIRVVETRKVTPPARATKKKGQKPKKQIKAAENKKLESTLHAAKDEAVKGFRKVKAAVGL